MNACLEHEGYITTGGYGRVHISAGRYEYVHRLAWMAAHGAIPQGMEIDHLCRNRACYRLDHLDLVTVAENQRRGLKGVLLTHCPEGHECCRTCNRRKCAERYAAQPEKWVEYAAKTRDRRNAAQRRRRAIIRAGG